MTTLFKVHPCTGDVARIAYELPTLPAGVSSELTSAIKAYATVVQEGPDDADEDAFRIVEGFTARSIQDVIAKVLYKLHFDHRGLDGETGALVIIDNKDTDTAEIAFAARVLEDLYSQIPRDWPSARKAYHSAVLAEQDYDMRAWMPAYHTSRAGGPSIPDAINTEYERLQEIRMSAEDVLLSMPAPSLAEWAIKYLICFDNGRDCNGITESLCAEGKRLLGIAEDTDDEPSELKLLRDVAAWAQPVPPLGIREEMGDRSH